MSEKLAKQIIELKETLKNRELKIAECKGKLSGLLKQITDYGCISREESEVYAKELEARIEILQEEIHIAIEKIEKELKNVGTDQKDS